MIWDYYIILSVLIQVLNFTQYYYEMPYIRQAYMNPTGLQQKPKREYVKIESRERGKVLSIPIQGYKLTKNNKQLNQC